MGKEWDALLEFIATFYGSLRELYFTEKGDTLLSEASNISLPPPPPSFSLVDVSAEYDDSNPRPVLNKMFYNYDVPRTAVETEN